MGTVVQRGGSFRAIVRVVGTKAQTKSFDSRKAADIWITQTEAAITLAPRITRGKTLGFFLEKVRLREEAKPYRSGSLELLRRINREIGHMDLADCSAEFWRETMLGWKVSPATRQTYIRRIKAALSTSEALWDAKVNWEALRTAIGKLKAAKELKKGKGRTRRVSDAELSKIKTAGAYYEGKIPFADVVDFAVLTCMRQAEIFRITWKDLSTDERGRPMLTIRDRKDPNEKIGNDQDIPLLGDAYKIIKRQPRRILKSGATDQRIFPFQRMTFCALFSVIVEKAKLENLHFHDLRHEGITRLFEQGYSIDEVCNVSGHKDWNTLRGYTHTSGKSLHDGPVSQRIQSRRAA